MRPTLTRGTALALLPALGMLVLAGCGDDSAGAPPATAPTTTPTATPSDVVTPTGPASSPASTSTGTPKDGPSNTADPSGEQADVTLNVSVANGKVNPSGASIKLKAGQTILITASSDVEDELHVHGYDKELELKPGRTASVKFTADTKGTFEVETHESGKLVAKLVVS